jgi:glycosyltransferase involved in cell wall biosynthesis
MKVNIIIPFYKNLDTIENLIRSIDDQDYKDFDVTIVMDGEDEEADKKLQELYFDKAGKGTTDFKLYLERLEENKGASAARNFGAYISGQNVETDNGNNILFFIDGDCKLYPGMLRECVNQLEDNPDVDFVYGNYRFEDKQEFYSQPFDPYLLETMNYISTMSPIRRRAFNKLNGFNELPYFQDWDLFYRAAKDGMKGKFINEFIFSTKVSGEDNISGEKGMSLSEKAAQFREWNKIEDKTLVATTFSAPLQAIQRAKMLNADYVGMAKEGRRQAFPVNYQFENWKATYMCGVFNAPIEAFENHVGVVHGKPIYHFIGSDVLQLMEAHSVKTLQGIKKAIDLQEGVVLGNSPRLVEELKECGLKDAKLVYTPIYNIDNYKSTKPLPKDFTIGVYFSDSNRVHKLDGAGGYSNIPLITDVARSMPNVKFLFFGGSQRYSADDLEKDVPENIQFVGRIPEENMVDFINSCSAVVRSTVHDGFPQLPIQFLLCGRQALISCPDKELKYAKKLNHEEIHDAYDDAKEDMINKIYQMMETPSDVLDQIDEVQAYYKDLMSEDTFREEIYKCMN